MSIDPHIGDRPVVIFGIGQLADVAHVYLVQSGLRVAGFSVDAVFRESSEHSGLPVFSWEALEKSAAPSDVLLFCPISYRSVNAIRKAKFQEGKRRGYEFASFVHPSCINNSAFVGENCLILENNILQPFSGIGDNVIMWSGSHLGHHSTVGSHSFLASQVVVSGGVTVGERCFLGVNSTLGDNIALGEAVVVGAGALVLKDLPRESVVGKRGDEISAVPSSRLRGF